MYPHYEGVLQNGKTVVVFTNDESLNIGIANFARKKGGHDLICRLDHEANASELAEGIRVFSTLGAQRTLLQAFVEHPAMIRLLRSDQGMQEIMIANEHYLKSLVKDLALPGNALIVRIFRGDTIMIPRGDKGILF